SDVERAACRTANQQLVERRPSPQRVDVMLLRTPVGDGMIGHNDVVIHKPNLKWQCHLVVVADQQSDTFHVTEEIWGCSIGDERFALRRTSVQEAVAGIVPHRSEKRSQAKAKIAEGRTVARVEMRDGQQRVSSRSSAAAGAAVAPAPGGPLP